MIRGERDRGGKGEREGGEGGRDGGRERVLKHFANKYSTYIYNSPLLAWRLSQRLRGHIHANVLETPLRTEEKQSHDYYTSI